MTSAAYGADELSQTEFDERFLPAVSGPNAKIALGYSHFDFEDVFFGPGFNDDKDGFFVEGSIAVPLGERFGLQIDGLYQDADEGIIDLTVRAVGAHLFWRDPNQALLGLYAEAKEYGDLFDSYLIAGEAEFYLDDFSIEAFAGLENLETPTGDSDFFAGQIQLAYYPTENSRISIGASERLNTTSLIVGGEFMHDTGVNSPSVFVNAAFGEDSTTTVSGGLRIYLGNEAKSLIRRHREDDPENRLKQGIDAVGTCINNAQSSLFGGPRMGMPPVTVTTTPPPMHAVLIEPVFDDCTLSSGLGPRT